MGKAGPARKWGRLAHLCPYGSHRGKTSVFHRGRATTVHYQVHETRQEGDGSWKYFRKVFDADSRDGPNLRRRKDREKTEVGVQVRPGFVAWRVGSSAVRSTTGRRPYQVNFWESDEGPAQGKVAVFFSGTRPSAGQARGTKTRKVKPVF